MKYYLAIDIGASSGRHILGHVENGSIVLEEVWRFDNKLKKVLTGGTHRVIYHAHPTNLIALTFVLPLTDGSFTRELWEMATECPVVFPAGVGVVP